MRAVALLPGRRLAIHIGAPGITLYTKKSFRVGTWPRLLIAAPLGVLIALTPAVGLHFAYTELASSGAERFAVLSVSFATLGWLITSWVTRSVSRRQHTVSVLLQHRFSPEMERKMRVILARYPFLSPVTPSECSKLRNAAKSKVLATTDNPTDDSDASLKGVYNAIISVLNYYEFLAIGIKRGDLDAIVMHDFYRSMMAGLADHCSSVVLSLQKENPRVYENLTHLYRSWWCSASFPKASSSVEDAADKLLDGTVTEPAKEKDAADNADDNNRKPK